MIKVRQIKIVRHFSELDEECQGDIYGMDVFLDDKRVVHWDDWYHDQPDDKLEGFLLGLRTAGMKFDTIETDVADFEE